MTSHSQPLRTAALSAITALFCAAGFTATADASPTWKFNGTELEGLETTVNHAVESSLTIPGLTTTCEPFVLGMTIFNSAGDGKGNVTKVPLSNCFTNGKHCTVATIEAENLPWPAKLTTVGVSDYLVIEGIELSVLYAGEECVLGEIEVVISGSAGALINNASESATFSPSSFSATGTALEALGQPAQWAGAFTMIGIGPHIGESLTV